ncbi:MAG: hypothetical protein KIT43_10420 [Bauldia sp.]|nr:hypothetical protein [Bauldia sp.]
MHRADARRGPAMSAKRGAGQLKTLAAAAMTAGLVPPDALRAFRMRVARWFGALPLLLAASVANAQQVPYFWPTTAEVVTALGMDNSEVTLWFHHPDCLFGN